MNKWSFFLTVLLAICVSGYAAETNDLFKFYRSIVENRSLGQSDRETKVQELLGSLNCADFLGFVRDAAKKEPRYTDERSEFSLTMHFFASIYANGPGKAESLQESIAQLSDSTLPSTWKIALLDALKLNRRSDMAESEVIAVTSALSEAGQSKQNSDIFRSMCFNHLGNFLITERERITQKAPDVKDALDKQDRTALPKRDDANVRQAAKLIDAIRDYKTALQKTADEVKDEQIKANLKNRLTKWESAPATPNK